MEVKRAAWTCTRGRPWVSGWDTMIRIVLKGDPVHVCRRRLSPGCAHRGAGEESRKSFWTSETPLQSAGKLVAMRLRNGVPAGMAHPTGRIRPFGRTGGRPSRTDRASGSGLRRGWSRGGPLPPVYSADPGVMGRLVQRFAYKGGFAQGTSLGFEMICPTSLEGSGFVPQGFTCSP